MNTNKALFIISRKMAEGTQSERESFNFLVDHVAANQKQVLIDNQLFGKLYIHMLGEFIKHYQTTVFDDVPQKELHKILDKPLKLIVMEFVDTINMGENYQDPTGKTAKWGYDETADNLRAMVVKALETFK